MARVAWLWFCVLIFGISTGSVKSEEATSSAKKSDDTRETKNSVCFGNFACFDTNGEWFHALLRPFPAPESPKDINTTFHLYDQLNNIENYTIISWPNLQNLKTSMFDPNRDIFVLTHGFGSSAFRPWTQSLRKTLNKHGQVILVQWEIGAGRNYLQSGSNTRTVGLELARLLRALHKDGISLEKVHLIGHSLGAQVSGYAGKNLTDFNLKRITGLDPAQPGFDGLGRKVHLSKGDAKYVDIIHTSARSFIPFLGFGMIDTIGDVDFFVNGGAYQPGCLDIGKQIKDTGLNITSLKDLAEIATETLLQVIPCSHSRSYEIFEEAILSEKCNFWAMPKAIKEVYEETSKQVDTVVRRVSKFSVPGSIRRFGTPIVNQGTSKADTIVNNIANIAPDTSKCTVEKCTVLGLDTFKFNARGTFFVETEDRSPFCIKNEEMEATLGPHLNS